MDTKKLQDIISNKNDQLERHTVHKAEVIINEIILQQSIIAKANEEIVELRATLAKLEVVQIDPATVLG